MRTPNGRAKSAFADLGFRKTIDLLKAEVQELYRADAIPWVLGYSGGKDSTATLQLVWLALKELPHDQRSKPVHVISTDTLVENPVVAAWVTRSLQTMGQYALKDDLPIRPQRLTPEVSDTFWTNLIGKGYPAPRPKFRWCTERLKIKPSNRFINQVVRENGEAILILGTRKAESQKRALLMNQLEMKRVRDRLSPNASLPNSLVYSPVEDWSNDDVWLFLMQVRNPWGYDNKDLLTMYQGASADGECPLVVDASTPSCGDSRFGCWVCTLVEQDRSMAAMIQNDEEKQWMQPLLDLRNELDLKDDRHLRDFRRITGNVQMFHDRNVPGPYKQSSREHWLKRVLEAQTWVRKNGPEYVRELELISLAELEEIRRIWVVDKHEFEDNLPKIYQEVTLEPYPGARIDDGTGFGSTEIDILRGICGSDELHFEMVRELLDVERRYRTMARRAGLYDALEQSIRRSFFDDEADAERARQEQRAREEAREGTYRLPIAGRPARSKGADSTTAPDESDPMTAMTGTECP
jgi:DNA sulfur modification protein DndC